MARFISTIPNQAEETTVGETAVRFTADRGQMLSEPVSDSVAAILETIPGYERLQETPKPAKPAKPPAKPGEPQGDATSPPTEPAGDGAAQPGG